MEITKKAYEQNPDRWIENYSKSLNNLGYLYQQAGKIKEAEELYKEALEITKKAYEQNPDRWVGGYSTFLNNLGSLYSDTGKIKEAEKVFKKILEILENIDNLIPTLQQIKQNAMNFFENSINILLEELLEKLGENDG